MSSSWVASAIFANEGLWLPPSPERRAAGLHLGADVVTVASGRHIGRLPWDRFGGDGQKPGHWLLTGLLNGRGGSTGVGVHVAGDGLTAATEDVWRRRRWRLATWPLADPRLIPLKSALDLGRTDAEIDTLTHLCRHLRDHPDARRHLTDPARVVRLAREMGTHTLRALPWSPTGLRRLTVEVTTAMHRLGYVHRLGGRPGPGDRVAPVPDVVAAVVDALTRSQYTEGLRLDRRRIEKVVRRHYTDVEPWPFAALADLAEPPSAGP
jgi:hypothetical protein